MFLAFASEDDTDDEINRGKYGSTVVDDALGRRFLMSPSADANAEYNCFKTSKRGGNRALFVLPGSKRCRWLSRVNFSVCTWKTCFVFPVAFGTPVSTCTSFRNLRRTAGGYTTVAQAVGQEFSRAENENGV